ncbi:hypothetical protein [Pseudoalteromonas sp. T1lg88]|uniref:hypothetical protein n=1 Tax=Pseudoalteromonas sp. T1lg88 TaxID=2077104 RepID=UPI000CF6148A|nr:hypothetical protein [Pseudoalteromonas sp. T1lg88]
MDEKLLFAIYGTLSTLIVALVGFYRKVHHERVQTKKSVLFHLLEIRHSIKVEYADHRELSDMYFEYCKSYFIEIGFWGEHTENNEELNRLITSLFEAQIEHSKPTLGTEFSSSFYEVIQALSKDDPFLAHYLKDKQNIKLYLQSTSAYTDKLQDIECIAEEPLLSSYVQQQSKESYHSNIEELLKDIDADILKVAWSIDIPCFLKCWWRLKNKNKPQVNLEELGIKKELNSQLHALVNHIKQA